MVTGDPSRFSVTERDDHLDRLASESFDVVVIGGGITGAGVALDAASRGLRTALVERGDFAAGTSSRSSKLVHGGLRYLNQREFRLVYEALAERQRLLRLAPHLVRSLPFLIPVFGTGRGAKAYARAAGMALWMYDLTGGARIGRLHQRLNRAEVLAEMPDLDASRLAAGFLYYDARVDDARLTLAVVRSAAHHGAVVANYVEATGLRTDPDPGGGPARGRIGGVEVRDVSGRGERSFCIDAGVVVNAAGVWADQLAALAGGEGDQAGDGVSIRPAKGVHITLPAGRPRLRTAAVLPVPGDKRSVFVIPWDDRVYVGTTDTDYDGGLDDPSCTAADVDYLLGALNASITSPVDRSEVTGTWAGLRPLVSNATSARTADLSRRHSVLVGGSGLVTIVGGKLTTYRRMAADAVDTAAEVLGRGRGRCRGRGRGRVRGSAGGAKVPRSRTGTLPLFGAGGYHELAGPDGPRTLGLSRETADHLAGRYGGGARELARMIAADPALCEPLVPGLAYLRAEAVYAARREMAVTLEDVLSRRTRALLLDEAATATAAPEVAALLAPELGWSEAETARQIETFTAAVERRRRAAGTACPAPDPAESALDARLFSGRGPEVGA